VAQLVLLSACAGGSTSACAGGSTSSGRRSFVALEVLGRVRGEQGGGGLCCIDCRTGVRQGSEIQALTKCRTRDALACVRAKSFCVEEQASSRAALRLRGGGGGKGKSRLTRTYKKFHDNCLPVPVVCVVRTRACVLHHARMRACSTHARVRACARAWSHEIDDVALAGPWPQPPFLHTEQAQVEGHAGGTRPV